MEHSPFNAASLWALLCAISMLSAPAGAVSDPPAYEFDIAAVPLSAAMEELAAQTGLQYSSFNMQITHLLVGPLKGRYTADDALTRLLRTTGLTFEWINHRTVRIAPIVEDFRRCNAQAQRCIEEAKHSDWISSLEVVTVCESRILGANTAYAPPIQLEHKRIKETGAATTSDLLDNIMQQPYAHSDDARSTSGRHIDLRGMGADSTGVLINGRPTAPSPLSLAHGAFDVRAIPLPAVERIDVMADLAPVRYGADISGGVVNFVLKREIPYPEVALRYGSARGGAARSEASLGAGFAGERLRGTVVLDFLALDALPGSERDLWRNQDYRRFDSLDLRSTATHPGNISSIDGTNLPGLPAPFVAIPPGTSAADLAPQDYFPGVGQRNLESPRRYWSILPTLQQAAAAATAELDLGPRHTAFGEFLYSRRSTMNSFGSPAISGLIVPAGNPFNPFGVPVRVDYRFAELGEREQRIDTELLWMVGGVRGQHRDWDWELSMLHSREAGHARLDNEIEPQRLLTALAATDPARALNVFHDGPAAEPAVLAALLAAPIGADYDSRLTRVAGHLEGPVARIGTAVVSAALGIQAKDESIAIGADGSDVSASLAYSRQTLGAFNEWRVPLLKSSSPLGSLSLTAGLRVDRYEGFSPEANEQVALSWQPLDGVTVHAAYGTTFRPPSLIELLGPRAQTVFPVRDLRRQGEIVLVTVHSGSNPDLRPSDARSLIAGITLAPVSSPELRLSARYWETSVRNRIAHTAWNVLLEHEHQFPHQIVRSDPTAEDVAAGMPGRLLALDISPGNFGSLLMRGLDLQISDQFSGRFGELTPSLTATYVRNYLAADIPNQPPLERVGIAHAQGTVPQWRALASIAWRKGALGFDTAARYSSGYKDVRNSTLNGRRVSSQVLVDIQVMVDLDAIGPESSLLQGLTLAAGARNIFDRAPPFSEVNIAEGYDASQSSLLQRFWYVHLSKRL
jgi:iron complex outermembrane receptor protein